MKSELTEVLDCALSRLAAGEAPADILAAYPRQAPALKPLLEAAQALEALRAVPMPPTQVLAARRQAFLAEAEQIRRRRSIRRPASAVSGWPIAGWERLMQAFGLSSRPFARLVATLVLAFGLVCTLGSVGLVAARHSLPGSPLYPVKLLSEEIGLSLTPDVTRKADMYLRLALERAQEMARLAQAGRTIDPVTLERMNARLDQALQLAAQLDDAHLSVWLGGAQRMLLDQARALQQVPPDAASSTRTFLEQAAARLEEAGRQAESGQQHPQRFRQQRSKGETADSTPPPATPALVNPPSEQPAPAPTLTEPTPSGALVTPQAPAVTPSPEPAGPRPQAGSPSQEPATAQPDQGIQAGAPGDEGNDRASGGDTDAGRASDQGHGSDAGKQEAGREADGGGKRQGR